MAAAARPQRARRPRSSTAAVWAVAFVLACVVAAAGVHEASCEAMPDSGSSGGGGGGGGGGEAPTAGDVGAPQPEVSVEDVAAFHRWFLEAGGSTMGIQLATYRQELGEVGIRAVAPVAEGEQVLSIPLDLVM